MGILAFIVVLALLGRIGNIIEGVGDFIDTYAPYIAVLLSALAAYRFTRGKIDAAREESEKARKAEEKDSLKEELREEVRREIRQEMQQGSIQQPKGAPTRPAAQAAPEEEYYPETRYFSR